MEQQSLNNEVEVLLLDHTVLHFNFSLTAQVNTVAINFAQMEF